ncbi:MAG: phage/plasmid primase, P4 family [Candidatus Nitrosocaldus sp.]
MVGCEIRRMKEVDWIMMVESFGWKDITKILDEEYKLGIDHIPINHYWSDEKQEWNKTPYAGYDLNSHYEYKAYSTMEELEAYYQEKGCEAYAIRLGKLRDSSNNKYIVGIDVDSREYALLIDAYLKDNGLDTMKEVTPRGGMHFYYLLPEDIRIMIRINGIHTPTTPTPLTPTTTTPTPTPTTPTNINMLDLAKNTTLDIKLYIEKRYFIHIAKKYQIINGVDKITTLTPDSLDKINDTLSKIIRLTVALKDYYIEGKRDYLWLYLSGYMYKLNVELEEALIICRYVCLFFKDREVSSRLKVVENTYAKKKVGGEVKGLQGLQHELGIPLATINEIRSIFKEKEEEEGERRGRGNERECNKRKLIDKFRSIPLQDYAFVCELLLLEYKEVKKGRGEGDEGRKEGEGEAIVERREEGEDDGEEGEIVGESNKESKRRALFLDNYRHVMEGVSRGEDDWKGYWIRWTDNNVWIPENGKNLAIDIYNYVIAVKKEIREEVEEEVEEELAKVAAEKPEILKDKERYKKIRKKIEKIVSSRYRVYEEYLDKVLRSKSVKKELIDTLATYKEVIIYPCQLDNYYSLIIESYNNNSNNKNRFDSIRDRYKYNTTNYYYVKGKQPVVAINTRNCVLLVTATDIISISHEKAKFCYPTRVINASYDPYATCNRFKNFLLEISSNDKEKALFLAQLIGLFLTKRMNEIFIVFYGVGANGKSTLAKVITNILGDYARFSNVSMINAKEEEGKNPELIACQDKHLICIFEPKQVYLNSANLKAITSLEPKSVRTLHKLPVEIMPDFYTILATNNKPVITDFTLGMLRRLIMVKFDHVIPEEKRIENYDKVLLGEEEEEDKEGKEGRSGILNLMLLGLQRYLQEGKLKIPDSIKKDTAEWIWEMDNLQEFIDRYLEFTNREEDRIEFASVYERYKFFCTLKNIKEKEEDNMLSKQEFSKRIKDKGFITIADYVKKEEGGKEKKVKVTFLCRAKWKDNPPPVIDLEVDSDNGNGNDNANNSNCNSNNNNNSSSDSKSNSIITSPTSPTPANTLVSTTPPTTPITTTYTPTPNMQEKLNSNNRLLTVEESRKVFEYIEKHYYDHDNFYVCKHCEHKHIPLTICEQGVKIMEFRSLPDNIMLGEDQYNKLVELAMHADSCYTYNTYYKKHNPNALLLFDPCENCKRNEGNSSNKSNGSAG